MDRNEIYNIAKDALYDYGIELIDDRIKYNVALNKEWLFDFLDEHPGIGIAYMIFIPIIIILTLSILAFFVGYKIDIAKLNEEARICQETGYGCTSNTINKDIKYDNTPIIEVNNDK